MLPDCIRRPTPLCYIARQIVWRFSEIGMKRNLIPPPVVWRLSLYLRELQALAGNGVEKTSSRKLAQGLKTTDAQVRKDLACFGQFGRPGVGYRVAELIQRIRQILKTDKVRPVVVVGAGDLGRALLRHKGFLAKGFNVVGAFDVSATLVGQTAGSVPVRHIDELPEFLRQTQIRLAVLAVPPQAAQEVCDLLCEAGIQGILNFAPISIAAPQNVTVRQVDLTAELEQLSFHVANQ